MSIPTEITTGELRTMTGLAEATIRRWKNEKVIRPEKRGWWKTTETIRAITSHLRTHSSGGEREKLLREQTRWKRLKNEELERQLLPAADVEDGFVELAGMFKAALLAFGARVAPELTGIQDQGQVREIVNTEVHRVLSDLSERLFQISRELKEQ